MSAQPRIFRANSSDAAQDMPDANNQRRNSNASSLSWLSSTGKRTPKSSKKEGLFGNAAVNAAVSGIASSPFSNRNNDFAFEPVKWDNNTELESVFSVNGQDALTQQTGLNRNGPPTPTPTSTPPVAMFQYTPENSLFTPAAKTPFNSSQTSRTSGMGSSFGSGAVPNNLFGNSPFATISNTPWQPTTNETEEVEEVHYESVLPPGFASPEELELLIKPRASETRFGSVCLGRKSGGRRSASFHRGHGKPNRKPRPVASAGRVQIAPALPQTDQQQPQQQQELGQLQPWSLIDDNSKPLENIATSTLPPPSTSSSSTNQKTSAEWLGMINTELKSLTQHIKIAGAGHQAKLYEIATLLVEIKRQQKNDSEALAKALQVREDQNKKGLEGFVDNSLKFMAEVVSISILWPLEDLFFFFLPPEKGIY